MFKEVGDDGKPVDLDDPFCILADSGGVRFRGVSRRINDMGSLQVFAKTLDLAWRAYLLAFGQTTKVTNAAGH